jgi:hypothetical protein
MEELQKDTTAWIVQVWVSFMLSMGTTLAGIWYLPVEPWVKAFMFMGLVFTVGSSFTLAKTIRDNHESSRLINRLKDAKAEKILRDFEIHDAA